MNKYCVSYDCHHKIKQELQKLEDEGRNTMRSSVLELVYHFNFQKITKPLLEKSHTVPIMEGQQTEQELQTGTVNHHGQMYSKLAVSHHLKFY